MTVDQKPTISVDDIRSALPRAMELVGAKWLSRQRKRRSGSKSLLEPKAALFSRAENLHAVRVGYPKPAMHPVAECLISAERSLCEYDRGIRSLPSAVLLCRVLSLRDVALARNQVRGLAERVPRLMSPDWKPALYEMLTAVSYPSTVEPTLLPEASPMPSPDLRLSTHPTSFVECKARLQHEKRVGDFVAHWRRSHLSQIHKALVPGTNSYVVRVEVNSLTEYRRVPDGALATFIATMVEGGRVQASEKCGCTITIGYWAADEVLLRQPVPAMTREFWEHGWGFDEWDNWHYILPTGEIALSDADPRIATRYRQRLIVCVRASELAGETPSVISTLKSACRRQLGKAETGLVHLLLDSNLFGLGTARDVRHIEAILQPEISRIFQDYSRLWRVYIDVMVRGEFFESSMPSAHRLEATNPTAKSPKKYQRPCSVLLV